MRVRLSLPADWDFATELSIRVSDLNYGGHLGNDRVLTLLHEIRVQWLRSFGWHEMDVAGSGIIQIDASVQYKKQAFLGDLLTGRLAVTDTSTRGFTLTYQLERSRDSQEIARATTNLLFFHYEKQSLASIPAEFSDRFAGKPSSR